VSNINELHVEYYYMIRIWLRVNCMQLCTIYCYYYGKYM